MVWFASVTSLVGLGIACRARGQEGEGGTEPTAKHKLSCQVHGGGEGEHRARACSPDPLRATGCTAKVGQGRHGARQEVGFALGTHPSTTAPIPLLKAGLEPRQPQAWDGPGESWQRVGIAVVVSTWTCTFRRGWSGARHHPAPGNGRGTRAGGQASVRHSPAPWHGFPAPLLHPRARGVPGAILRPTASRS